MSVTLMHYKIRNLQSINVYPCRAAKRVVFRVRAPKRVRTEVLMLFADMLIHQRFIAKFLIE